MIREIEKKFPTIEEIDCDSCGNVVSYDGEVKQNFTTVSKWVPHKTGQHRMSAAKSGIAQTWEFVFTLQVPLRVCSMWGGERLLKLNYE